MTPVSQVHTDKNFCKNTSAKRKLVFETPEKIKKRRRSIMANRAKRRRYSKNKHIKYTWKKKDSERWKERATRVVQSPDEEFQRTEEGSPVHSPKESVAHNSSDVDVTAEFLTVQNNCALDRLHTFPDVQVSSVRQVVRVLLLKRSY